MEFKSGERVIGKEFEFKGKNGTVLQQYSEAIVLVIFDDFPMCVAMMASNLEKVISQ